MNLKGSASRRPAGNPGIPTSARLVMITKSSEPKKLYILNDQRRSFAVLDAKVDTDEALTSHLGALFAHDLNLTRGLHDPVAYEICCQWPTRRAGGRIFGDPGRVRGKHSRVDSVGGLIRAWREHEDTQGCRLWGCFQKCRQVEGGAIHDVRVAYSSVQYRTARAKVLRRSKGQCEAILPDGSRCTGAAQEAHHVTPLSTVRTVEEAIALTAAWWK